MASTGQLTIYRNDCFGLVYTVGLLRYQQAEGTSEATIEGTQLPVEIINLAREELSVQLSRLSGMVSRLQAKPETPITDQHEAELIQAAENVLTKRFHCEMVYNEINAHPSIWVQTLNGDRLTAAHDAVCGLYDLVDDAMQKKISEIAVCVGGKVWNELRSKSANRTAFIWYLGKDMLKAYRGELGA